MSKFTVASLAFVAVIAITSAVTPEEKDAVKAAVIPMLEECSKELKIPKEEILAAKENKDVDALDSCYYACFFKKIGFLNDKNMFDVETAKEKSNKYISGDETIEKLSEIATTCSAVNDEDVSDENGCDRAKLLLKCFLKEKHALLSDVEVK